MSEESTDGPKNKNGITIKGALNSATSFTPVFDPYAAYSDAALAKDIAGTLLKFSKGDFFAGKDNMPIAIGTTLIANMWSFSVGWIKWAGGKPVETIMGRVADNFEPPRRDDLGDTDRDLWETDDKNVPRDPWQYTVRLEFADPESGEVYTFSASSDGSRRALDKLCQSYARVRAKHLDEWPLVELGVDSYQHSNKALGRIKFPVFTIVDWVPKDNGTEDTPAPAIVNNPLGDDDVPPPGGPEDYGSNDLDSSF
jgi:hypothetical protein